MRIKIIGKILDVKKQNIVIGIIAIAMFKYYMILIAKLLSINY